MPIATMEITTMPVDEPTNILMTLPTKSTIMPTNSHWPMPERSRLMTDAKLAITKNTPAVPPKAVMISSGPLEKPSVWPIMRESIRPIKNVKPNNTGTPMAEFLVFSMA